MSIDMSQFHDVLFEECFECLDVMESGLMSLDLEDVDLAELNPIFRGAHTIKGSCATFGFHAAADYALALEKQLNEMRNGAFQITPPIKDILLSSVDFLRGVVTDMQNEKDVNEVNMQKHKEGFEAELARLSQS